jgi:hypothetical protein
VANPIRSASPLPCPPTSPCCCGGNLASERPAQCSTWQRPLGCRAEVVIASIREPSDFAGLPVVDGAELVRFAPPRWAERLSAEGRGVLFLDELTTAPPAVQAALLRVVFERAVGDLELPPDVVILAAANPTGTAANGWDLTAPAGKPLLPPRLGTRSVRMVRGCPRRLRGGTHPRGEPGSRTRKPIPTFGAHFCIRRDPSPPLPPSPFQLPRRWPSMPSPRTWEMAATLLAHCELGAVPTTVTTHLLRGAVGPGAAAEYLAWQSDLALPDPEAVPRRPPQFCAARARRSGLRGVVRDRCRGAVEQLGAALGGRLGRNRCRLRWRERRYRRRRHSSAGFQPADRRTTIARGPGQDGSGASVGRPL